jgi:hypothetical protein
MDKFIGQPKGQKVAAIEEGSGLKNSIPEEDLEDLERKGVVATTTGMLAQLIEQ